MRISLSGAPGTGKTTLGKLLGEYTTLEYISETEERVIRETGYKNIKELLEKKGVEGLIENFFLSLEKKIREETEKDNYVTDKSIFDVGARWFGRLWENMKHQQHEKVRSVMGEFAKNQIYDRIIYLPLNRNRAVEDDGSRTTEFETRYQRSLIIQGLAAEYNIEMEPYNFLFSDSPLKVINDLDLNPFLRKNDD